MFTDREQKDLTQLLHLNIGNKNVLTLDGLHGYLFGLAILPPKFVMSTSLVPGIFDGAKFQVGNSMDVKRLLDNLCHTLYRMIDASENNELVFPFNIDTIDSKDIYRIREWTQGFFKASVLCRDLWHINEDGECDLTDEQLKLDECEDDCAYIECCFSIITGVISQDSTFKIIINDDRNLYPPGLRDLEFDDARLIMMLPGTILELQKYAQEVFITQFQASPVAPLIIEKVGRNSPCPCGSGNKYKKCCGK